jgi:hypothetical protein
MTVTVLYVSGAGTVVGALSQAVPTGGSVSPRDITGSNFPIRIPPNWPDLPVPVDQLSVATLDAVGMDQVFSDPGGYAVAVGPDKKPQLTTATNPHPGTLTLSKTSGITIATAAPAGAAVVIVLQDTTSQAAQDVVTGTTTAGRFAAARSLAAGPWNVAWFIAGSRPGTHHGIAT